MSHALIAVPARLSIEGKSIEVRHWRQQAPGGTILLIHEALGSVSYWKEFPETLAHATSHDVIAYSRAGHGSSEGPVEPRSLAYYRRQVDIVLPAILKHFSVEAPVLYGHSEGAAIAMLYAATGKPVHSIVAEAPIVRPEASTGETIRLLAESYQSSDMGRRLARYHANPDEVFHSWIDSNRASFSKDDPLERYLGAIRCAVLVLQGSRDEFGGILQFESIQRSVPEARHAVFDAGHLLHREQPELVAKTVAFFLSSLL